MKWLRSAERAAAIVAAALVAALFLVLLAGVAGRYVLGRPLAWSDELAVVLFIWLVFWTGAWRPWGRPGTSPAGTWTRRPCSGPTKARRAAPWPCT